jgi:PmbA protein
MADNRFSFSQDNLKTIAEDILKFARKRGATACEVDVSEGFGQSVSVRRDEVDTIEYNRDKGVGVTIYDGQRAATPAPPTSRRTPSRPPSTRPLSIARFTAPDPAAGLPEEALLARSSPTSICTTRGSLSVEEAIELARRCEAAAFAVSPEIRNSEGASVSMQQSHFISANSLGFMGGYASSRHYLSCSVIAGEGDDMQRDDWYTTKRDPAELADADEIGTFAARRALPAWAPADPHLRGAGAVRSAARGRPDRRLRACSQRRRLYRKSTFLLDSLGKQVFRPHIQISERPHLPSAFASSPFDDDGVATHDREVIRTACCRAISCHLLGPQAGHADHRQCRRQPQPARQAGQATWTACSSRWAAACWSPNCSATASITSPATTPAAPPATGSRTARSSIRCTRSPSPATSRTC